MPTILQYLNNRKANDYQKGYESGTGFAIRNAEIIKNVFKEYFKKSDSIEIGFDSKLTNLVISVPEQNLSYRIGTPDKVLNNINGHFAYGYWDAYTSKLSEILGIALKNNSTPIRIYQYNES